MKSEQYFFEIIEKIFVPEFDADGNQYHTQTETGDWALNYNAANRPTDFSCMDEEGNFLTVKCDYDFMGRRVFKKVISGNGTVISHQRFIYRGYLQIACVDLTRTNHPCLWLITWDPTQPIATRPLAIQKDGTWYTYGLDLTKNVCEVFGPAGYIRTAYTYSPFGSVTATGNVTQPIQWSSEFYDEELGLVYYNWRSYNTGDGRWISRDLISEATFINLYVYVNNVPIYIVDIVGLTIAINSTQTKTGIIVLGKIGGSRIASGVLKLAAGTEVAKKARNKTQENAIKRAEEQAKREAAEEKMRRCRNLSRIKRRAINNAKNRACKKNQIPKKPTLQDCEWFKESADLFKAEYEARRNYDKECYAGGDKGHITQSSSKNAAENKCLSIYKECLKRAKKQNKCLVK